MTTAIMNSADWNLDSSHSTNDSIDFELENKKNKIAIESISLSDDIIIINCSGDKKGCNFKNVYYKKFNKLCQSIHCKCEDCLSTVVSKDM